MTTFELPTSILNEIHMYKKNNQILRDVFINILKKLSLMFHLVYKGGEI